MWRIVIKSPPPPPRISYMDHCALLLRQQYQHWAGFVTGQSILLTVRGPALLQTERPQV